MATSAPLRRFDVPDAVERLGSPTISDLMAELDFADADTLVMRLDSLEDERGRITSYGDRDLLYRDGVCWTAAGAAPDVPHVAERLRRHAADIESGRLNDTPGAAAMVRRRADALDHPPAIKVLQPAGDERSVMGLWLCMAFLTGVFTLADGRLGGWRWVFGLWFLGVSVASLVALLHNPRVVLEPTGFTPYRFELGRMIRWQEVDHFWASPGGSVWFRLARDAKRRRRRDDAVRLPPCGVAPKDLALLMNSCLTRARAEAEQAPPT